VIACIVENAGFGHLWAAPITTLLIEKYLTGKIGTPARQEMEKRMLEADFSDGRNLTSAKKK
jgi:penicillin-binding protein 2